MITHTLAERMYAAWIKMIKTKEKKRERERSFLTVKKNTTTSFN